MIVSKTLTAAAGTALVKGQVKRAAWIAALAVTLGLLLLPETVRLDGKPHADWQQFLGRFHPLAVHIPIGLIVLVPLLEIAGTSRPALREAAGFILAIALVTGLGTLVLGYLLAYGSGDAGAVVIRHMWGGVTLSILLLLCLLARPAWSAGTMQRVYPSLLVCMLLTLAWTAHQGGSITHGSSYLTEYLPAPLKQLFLLPSAHPAAPASNSFYAKHIDPIFESNCVACHGASKTQGGLRLDSYESLMRGGKDGAVVVPHNDGRSLLIERITLPADNHHFMPAEGRPPLKPREVTWIRAWIAQGASSTTTALADISIREEPRETPIQPVADYSRMQNDIRQVEQSQGARLIPVSGRPSDGLVLNATDVAASFGDAQLAQYERFAPYIVEAELARTKLTDASFGTLSRFSHLRALHLEGTGITGSGLARLASLSQLTYLNLSDTKVTLNTLAPLASMNNLHHVYLFDTPAQPAPAAQATQSPIRSTP